MQIEFIASVAIVTRDPTTSRKLFVETLGLPLEAAAGDEYFHSEKIGGSKHFGVWPLYQAAEACFGTHEWPVDRPIPQASTVRSAQRAGSRGRTRRRTKCPVPQAPTQICHGREASVASTNAPAAR